MEENFANDLLKSIKNSIVPNHGKQKIFDRAILTIENNIISCSDNFVQISNITRVWKGNLKKEKLPFIFLLISTIIALIIIVKVHSSVVYIGLIILVFNAYTFYKNVKQIQYYGLYLELNSGKIYFFISENRDFIQESFETLKNVIKANKNEYEYIINFGSGNILKNAIGNIID